MAYFINYVDRQIVFSIYPALRTDLGFSDVQLGLVGSIFTWIYSFCMPFTGRLADILPRQLLIAGSIVLWSLATLGTGQSGSVGEFLGWRAAMGITESLYVPAALGLLASLHPGATRSKALSIHVTAQFAGIIFGGWFGGYMADYWGWRKGFFGLATAGLIFSVILYLALRRTASIAPPSSAVPSSPRDLLGSKSFLTLTAAFFAFSMMLWMLYAWLPSFLHDRHGLSMTQSGLTATLYLQISSAIGVLSGGVLADAWAKRFVPARLVLASLGMILAAPFAWMIFTTTSLFALQVATAAFGLFGGLFIANLYSGAYDVVSSRNYGFAAGVLNLSGGFAGGSAIFLAGQLKQSFGIDGLTFCAALAAVICGVALLLVSLKSVSRAPAPL